MGVANFAQFFIMMISAYGLCRWGVVDHFGCEAISLVFFFPCLQG